MLDDILTLFRRRRAPARRRSPAGNGRWPINLETMGGPIYRTRGDAMPQTEPRGRAAASRGRSSSAQPRPEQPPRPQTAAAATVEAAAASRRSRGPSRAPNSGSAASDGAQAAGAPRTFRWLRRPPRPRTHVAEHGNYLAAHAVEKTFGTRKVVKGASLYVRRGEAVGLLGPNGAGKTTIFYMITGLIKADAGRIDLDGYDVTVLPMYQRARLGIGYLPQEPRSSAASTSRRTSARCWRWWSPTRASASRSSPRCFEEFNIERLRKTPSIALSGGERRRVEIARALATRPNYMLLDEPFAGIDPIAVGDLQTLVRHLTNRGIGVLITDHNVRETLGLTDRAYIIYSGEVLMEGRTEDIVNNPEVRRLYLGEEFRL